jgi:hypothetical protein
VRLRILGRPDCAIAPRAHAKLPHSGNHLVIKNNCQKQAIRARMAETGEDYTTAKEAYLDGLKHSASVRRDLPAPPAAPVSHVAPTQPRLAPGARREIVGVGTPACRVITKTPRPKVRTAKMDEAS